MRIRMYYQGRWYTIEAPDDARVKPTSCGIDCLSFDYNGKREYLPDEIALAMAARGRYGLKLVSPTQAGSAGDRLGGAGPSG